VNKDKSSQAPIDQWEAAIHDMLNPEHPNHETNTIRQQIKLATLAAELGLKVEAHLVAQRISEILRAKQKAERAEAAPQSNEFRRS
jgi:hypothetical protein